MLTHKIDCVIIRGNNIQVLRGWRGKMEFLIVFSLHFILMGACVVITSLAFTILWEGVPFILPMLISTLIGVCYVFIIDIPQLILFTIIYNGVISLIITSLIKFVQRKVRNIEMKENIT